MSDYLVKATAFGGEVRAYATTTTEMVSESQRRHHTWPTASAAMGRTITATTMMGAMLKGNDKLTVKIEGGGPIGAIVADANANGEARAYVSNPQVHFDLNEKGKLDVARAVGTEGSLSVVKDLGLRQNFTGSVPIVSGEIGEDFTYYYTSSEQVPSAFGVGVLVNPDNSIHSAGGFTIQMLPGASEITIAAIEKRLGEVPPISKLIEAGKSPEEVLYEVLGENNVKVIDQMPVTFHCNCSKERFANGIISLGTKEIQEMIDEDGSAEANCHFCRTTYHFDAEELEALKEESTRA